MGGKHDGVEREGEGKKKKRLVNIICTQFARPWIALMVRADLACNMAESIPLGGTQDLSEEL